MANSGNRDQTETTPLLPRDNNGKSSGAFRRYLATPISRDYADLPLLVCCFLTGLIDAGAFMAWSTFLGMQTGNTVFVALGLVSLPADAAPLQWVRSLLAICSFSVGSFLFSRLYRALGQTRRGTLMLCFVLQSLCLLVAASLLTSGVVPTAKNPHGNGRLILLTIPLLGAQFGAQVASSRALGFNEIPTTVLTSVYNDLASDPELWRWRNAKRNRRVAAVALILIGGICGGQLAKLKRGFEIVLWVSAVAKIGIALTWLGFGEEKE